MNLDELRASSAAVLTVAEVVRVLETLDGGHLDERTVRRAMQLGQLPCVHVGRRLLCPRLPLLELLGATPDMREAEPATGPAVATKLTATKQEVPRHGNSPDAA